MTKSSGKTFKHKRSQGCNKFSSRYKYCAFTHSQIQEQSTLGSVLAVSMGILLCTHMQFKTFQANMYLWCHKGTCTCSEMYMPQESLGICANFASAATFSEIFPQHKTLICWLSIVEKFESNTNYSQLLFPCLNTFSICLGNRPKFWELGMSQLLWYKAQTYDNNTSSV